MGVKEEQKRVAEMASMRARHERLTRQRQELIDDIDHYNRTRPDEPPIPYDVGAIDAILADLSVKLGVQ